MGSFLFSGLSNEFLGLSKKKKKKKGKTLGKELGL